MKILVFLKRVPDPETEIPKVKINDAGDGLVTDGLKFVIDPFVENGIEEALKIKEARSDVEEVVLLGLGPEKTTEQLRTGLAMGADRAILVTVEEEIEPITAARLAVEAIKKDGSEFDIFFCGKQASDDDYWLFDKYIAEDLGLPQATVLTEVKVADDGKTATCQREIDGGQEHVEVQLPAILSAELQLNEPRYASLKGIMAAKKKKLDTIPAADLGVDLSPAFKVAKYTPAPEKAPGRIIEGDFPDTVGELVKALKEEAKVL